MARRRQPARARSSRPDAYRRLPPPAFIPGWNDSIDRTMAQMLISPDPAQRATAARVILGAALREPLVH